MEKARQAVHDFMSKSGHHDTTVHETVAPAVTHETVKPSRHENVTTAVDREVHQEHYHTSVQPVTDRKILPEQHTHNVAPVQQKEFHHGKDAGRHVETRLAETAAQFKDKQVVAPTTETHSAAPVVAGEHIHHHVHETIQPVVQRETIQPHVVHTTVPIHEVHHNAPEVHSTSALPAVSMTDFKKKGGALSGREERFDGFNGEPRAIGSALGGTGAGVAGVGAAASRRRHHKRTGSASSYSSSSDDERGNRRHHRSGKTTTTGGGLLGKTAPNQNHSKAAKPGLLAKLDPRVDSNGDGKAGFMK